MSLELILDPGSSKGSQNGSLTAAETRLKMEGGQNRGDMEVKPNRGGSRWWRHGGEA